MDDLPRIAQVRIEPAIVGFMAYPAADDEGHRTRFRHALSSFVSGSTDWMIYRSHRDASGGWHSAYVVPYLPGSSQDV